MLTQDQVIALLNLLNNGKLIAELTEQLSIDTNDNFAAINVGTSDAKKVKIPLLRGYKGTYDANTNTPTLTNGTGLDGDMYVVSVAGSRDFGAGNVNLSVNDIIIYLDGKYLKTNGFSAGSLNLQDTYDNSNPKTIQVEDSISGTLVIKDSSTNTNREDILQIQDTSGNSLFYVQKNRSFIKDKVGVGQPAPNAPLEVVKNITFTNVDTFPQLTIKTDLETTGDQLGFGVDKEESLAFIQAVERGTATIPLVLQRYGGNVGINKKNPSEKLEVNGRIFINPDSEKIGSDQASAIVFESKNNNETASAKSRIFCFNTTAGESNMDFEVETSTGVFSKGFSLRPDSSGDVMAIVPDNLYVDKGDLGVGTETPSERLEVKGRIFINPQTQNIDSERASAIVFQSENFDGSASAKSRITSFNSSANKASMEFQVETSSNTYHTAIVIDNFNNSGDVRVSIPGTIKVDETVLLESGTYADLPSSPEQGMITYITDGSNVSYRATASGDGSDVALVFFDGNNWIYH